MLKGDAVLFKHAEHLSPKPNLGIHHGLLYVNRAESLLAGNSGDGVTRLAAGALHNKCALVLRTVGVPDIDGNALLAHRENGVLMKDAGSHVGKLPQFLVCNGLDNFRILHDSGVCHQNAGHIRPVLVHIRVDGLGHDRARNIGTASGKCFDGPIRLGTVKTRDNSLLHMLQTLGQLPVGVL